MRFLIAFVLAFCAAQALFCVITALAKCKAEAKIRLCEDKIELSLRRKSVLPWHFFARISVKNLYTGEEISIKTGRIFAKKDEVSYAAELENFRCGVITAEISEIKCGILTLFFRKKAQIKAADTRLVMPKIGEKISDFNFAMQDETLEKRSANGFPDGAREYQSGDRFGDIHMKLSAKTGKYMVRERFGDGNGLVNIAFFYDAESEIAEENARLLLEIVTDSLAQGKNCRILCGEKSVEIDGEWAVENAFFEILSQSGSEIFSSEGANLEISHGEVRAL